MMLLLYQKNRRGQLSSLRFRELFLSGLSEPSRKADRHFIDLMEQKRSDHGQDHRHDRSHGAGQSR